MTTSKVANKVQPLEEVVKATSHLQEPVEFKDDLSEYVIPVEIAEITPGCVSNGKIEPIPFRRVVYVAGKTDEGLIFYSDIRRFSVHLSGPIGKVGSYLNELAYYATVKKLD